MPDVCERCGFPAIEVAGNWQHAEAADAVFCSLVMQCLDDEDVNEDA